MSGWTAISSPGNLPWNFVTCDLGCWGGGESPIGLFWLSKVEGLPRPGLELPPGA